MDRQTAHTTYLAHRPSGWLAAIGLDRCVAGCGAWPCGPWLTARDHRGRDDTATMDRIRVLAAEFREQTTASPAAIRTPTVTTDHSEDRDVH